MVFDLSYSMILFFAKSDLNTSSSCRNSISWAMVQNMFYKFQANQREVMSRSGKSALTSTL